MPFTPLELQTLGLSSTHLHRYMQGQRQFLLHGDALAAFLLLKQAAATAGFNLAIVSSYRSYERQAAIWQAKAQGKRPLLDAHGELLDYQSLQPEQLLQAILQWSAAPGCSRHHWGTDIDIFDANRLAMEDVQLIPAEVEAQGACAALHAWLDARIANNQSFGFFRPYSQNACQVAEEKWHLSYLPQAMVYQQVIQPALIMRAWQQHPVDLLAPLKQSIARIYRDYVCLDRTVLPAWVQAATA